MKNTFIKTILGIIVVTILIVLEIVLLFLDRKQIVAPVESTRVERHAVRFLAFGDVNLGRTVGQKILHVSPFYPFEHYAVSDDSADIVFANLESQVSDQNGETGHPQYNLIFTAPPEAVATLQHSGISVFSTANNHALDYGINALEETIDHLRNANISFVGTSKQKENLFKPLRIEKNNIKFAIFGVTSFVNMTFNGWREYVATADTVQLLKEIEAIRDSVDIVVVSYHGGIEYADAPAQKVKEFADWCVNNGVDIFLGHHPHVSFGIVQRGNRYIVHSLGNFVFFQPQHYWTQRSYGAKFLIEKSDSTLTLKLSRLYPINVSMQTRRLTDSTERTKLFQRTQQLSNIDLTHYWN